jgi:hypothetical protein
MPITTRAKRKEVAKGHESLKKAYFYSSCNVNNFVKKLGFALHGLGTDAFKSIVSHVKQAGWPKVRSPARPRAELI